MKRMIKVLLVTALIAVILVVSISPAMARRGNFGHRMPTAKSCESTNSAQNEGGAHHKVDPDGHTGCWVVVPGLNE